MTVGAQKLISKNMKFLWFFGLSSHLKDKFALFNSIQIFDIIYVG